MEDRGGYVCIFANDKVFLTIQAGWFVLEIRLRYAHKYTNTL